jgi:N,N-dimethylformamidase
MRGRGKEAAVTRNNPRVQSLFFVFLVAAAAVASVSHAEEAGGERTLIGYASKLTVRPGDTLKFMVNSVGGASYHADLVRIVNGDALSRYRDEFEVRPIAAPFSGKHDGMEQELNLGSYIELAETGPLDGLKDFTVAGWMYPTFDPNEYQEPDLENPDPFYPPGLDIGKTVGAQSIISRFDALTRVGWVLHLNEAFQLEFIVGDGESIQKVTVASTTRDWDWTYVAASYDASTGTARIYQREKPFAPGDQFTARNLEAEGVVGQAVQAGPLRIAAIRGGPGAAKARFEKPLAVFNGRLQDVRIAKRVLSAEEIDALSAELTPLSLKRDIVADWDFGRRIPSASIEDVSGSGLHAELVNVGERAVRGRFWTGETLVWTEKPDHYDAITFHADDLYDAAWKSDFSYRVADDLPSGVYAARLTQDDFHEYIVFFVAPAKRRSTAKLALWLSEYNYLAYNNIALGATVPQNYPGHWWNSSDVAFMKANHEYATGGVYNKHVDGLYFIYGSPLRPDLHMKPNGGAIYNFSADTHITSFLEHEGIAYDVITDELIDAEGLGLLSQYAAVITSTHPEYVTTKEFDAIAAYTAGGGRLMYVGGNGLFWAVAENPGFPGVVESRNFNNITERYLTAGGRGGLMAETGRHSGPILGNEMSGMVFHGSSPYRRLPGAEDVRASWIFHGTTEGAVFGDYGLDKVKGGAAGFEVDRYSDSNGVPRHALQLATSEPLLPQIEDVKILDALPLSISYHPTPGDVWAQADLVFFETANGGAVFSTGSITWMSSALENDYVNDVATITRNVIERFIDPEPFPAITDRAVPDVDRQPRNPEYEHTDQR